MDRRTPPHDRDTLVRSALTLRTLLGVVGILLPFVLAIGDWLIFSDAEDVLAAIRTSISAYYYTGLREVLVGSLCAFGAFLVTYKGYDWWDNALTTLAGIGAVGVALFPTFPKRAGEAADALSDPDIVPTAECGVATVCEPIARAGWVGYAHLGFAVAFFGLIAILVLFRFTRSRYRLNNVVYVICGVLILVSIVLIPLEDWLPDWFAPRTRVFWLEAVAVLAFGVAWLVKGHPMKQLREALA